MQHIDNALEDIAYQVHEKLDAILPVTTIHKESKLFEAMRYATLSKGKRMRSLLIVTSANLFGISRNSALQVAAAIELIHAYSLVHDDLPALDNDDMRRGQPSCHKKFDEATAILTGDALLTYAFEVLADDTTHRDPAVRCELITSIAKAAGPQGMVGGQMMDMIAEHLNLSIIEITRLQRLKTGAMFAVSCEAGAILGKAPRILKNALRGYAHDLGLAFQITDDLLDVEGNTEIVGKNVRKDKTAGKATFVSSMGLDKAKEQANLLAQQAVNHLESFDNRADLLRDLATYVIKRKS